MHRVAFLLNVVLHPPCANVAGFERPGSNGIHILAVKGEMRRSVVPILAMCNKTMSTMNSDHNEMNSEGNEFRTG